MNFNIQNEIEHLLSIETWEKAIRKKYVSARTSKELLISCNRNLKRNESIDSIMEEKISNELLYGSILTDENVEYEKIDNETINVKLEMDFIQNIATSQPISADTEGEEILDKQTD